MNGYTTKLIWKSGLTKVVCTHCQASALYGTQIQHSRQCSQYDPNKRRAIFVIDKTHILTAKYPDIESARIAE